jgi:hypothetical protein
VNIDLESVILLLVTLQSAGAEQAGNAVINSLNNFGAQVLDALPNIVAALILLGIGYLVGRLAEIVVRKVSSKLSLDRYWNQTGIGQATASSGWNVSRLLSTAVKWFIYLFFIAAAVNVLQFQQISQAINQVWLWIPNVIAFIIILVVGSLLVDFVGRWMQRELPRRGMVAGKTIGLAATGILYAIVLTVAVTQLGIGEAILNSVITALVWGIAAALAIGLGVGLAYGLKDAVPSMIRGSTVIQPAIKAGQKISVDGVAGTVEEVGTFSIIIRDAQNRTVVVPTNTLENKRIVIESGPKPETQEDVAEKRGYHTETT